MKQSKSWTFIQLLLFEKIAEKKPPKSLVKKYCI